MSVEEKLDALTASVATLNSAIASLATAVAAIPTAPAQAIVDLSTVAKETDIVALSETVANLGLKVDGLIATVGTDAAPSPAPAA